MFMCTCTCVPGAASINPHCDQSRAKLCSLLMRRTNSSGSHRFAWCVRVKFEFYLHRPNCFRTYLQLVRCAFLKITWICRFNIIVHVIILTGENTFPSFRGSYSPGSINVNYSVRVLWKLGETCEFTNIFSLQHENRWDKWKEYDTYSLESLDYV